MASEFDERLKRLEQEIDDIKTARQQIVGATKTISKPVIIKGWAEDQDPVWGRPRSKGYTIITIKPQDPSNGFFFSISQPSVQDSSWLFDYSTNANFDMTEFQVTATFLASKDRWTPGETRAFTKGATIVASGQFDYTVEYEEPEE